MMQALYTRHAQYRANFKILHKALVVPHQVPAICQWPPSLKDRSAPGGGKPSLGMRSRSPPPAPFKRGESSHLFSSLEKIRLLSTDGQGPEQILTPEIAPNNHRKPLAVGKSPPSLEGPSFLRLLGRNDYKNEATVTQILKGTVNSIDFFRVTTIFFTLTLSPENPYKCGLFKALRDRPGCFLTVILIYSVDFKGLWSDTIFILWLYI